MKKNLKRTLAKVMVFALTVTLAGSAADADAAKKIKLSKKSITVTKGKSKKVTIKNVKAKKVKKLTVKSSKKKIATVKKTGNKKTAFKVTGKKVGSAKITVTLKVKGQKKATKLTLKVKVKKATAPKKTTTPAQTQTPSQAPASQAPTQNPTQAPTTEPTLAPTEVPNVYGEADPYKVTISDENESYADSDTKRVANGLDPNARNKDVVFNEDGSVTFTSTDKYNSGVTFYISGEVKTSTNDDGATVYTAKKVDLTQYTGVRFKLKDAYCETSLKVLPDGSNWWSKLEKWEGTDKITDGERTVEYTWDGFDVAALKEVDSIGLAWHNEEGFTATIESIEFFGKKEPAQAWGVTDPYKVTISDDNESYADSDTKRVANGLDPNARNKDVTFNEDGSVTFTSTDKYNSGVTFYISGDVTTSTNDDGATVYTAKKVDLTQYKGVRFKLKDAYCETSLKILPDGSNWWSKLEKWEGTDNITDGERTVEYDFEGLDVATLKEVDSIGLAWHNEEGFTATIESIEFFGAKDPDPVPTVEPTVAPTQTPEVETGKNETAGNDTAKNETAKNETAKNETAKNETAKNETAKSDTKDVTDPEDPVDTSVVLTGDALGAGAKYVSSVTNLGNYAKIIGVDLKDVENIADVTKIRVDYKAVMADGTDVTDSYKLQFNLSSKSWVTQDQTTINSAGSGGSPTYMNNTKDALAAGKTNLLICTKDLSGGDFNNTTAFNGTVTINKIEVSTNGTDFEDSGIAKTSATAGALSANTTTALVSLADQDLSKFKTIKVKVDNKTTTKVQVSLVKTEYSESEKATSHDFAVGKYSDNYADSCCVDVGEDGYATITIPNTVTNTDKLGLVIKPQASFFGEVAITEVTLAE